MKSQVLGLRVAATLFALASLGQLLRLLVRASVVVEGFQLPLWISGVACLVATALSLWLWKLSLARTAERKHGGE